jgi:hypothetical protein
MRISILKSVNAVEHQHKSTKGKLIIGITVHLFNCDYTSFLKNINQRIGRFTTYDKQLISVGNK